MKRSIVIACTLLLFLGLNGLVAVKQGIREGKDTPRFRAAAERFLAGQPLVEKQGNYAGFGLVVAASLVTRTGDAGIIALNLLFFALAAAAVAALAGEMSGPVAAAAGALITVANLDMARWNFYVMTESLYSSTVVLCAFSLWRAVRRGGWWWGAALASTAFGAALRPNGWLLVPIALSFVAAMKLPSMRSRVAAVALICAGFVAFAVAGPMRRGVQAESLSHELRIGEVVWNRVGARGAGLRMEMPAEPGIPETLRGSLEYALRHPVTIAKLASLRVLYHLGNIRPYYSKAHNLAVVLFLYPVYLFAVVGIAARGRTPLGLLLLAIAGAHLALVAITFANWDGRFLMYMLAPIFVFAGCGVARAAEALRRAPAPALSS